MNNVVGCFESSTPLAKINNFVFRKFFSVSLEQDLIGSEIISNEHRQQTVVFRYGLSVLFYAYPNTSDDFNKNVPTHYKQTTRPLNFKIDTKSL